MTEAKSGRKPGSYHSPRRAEQAAATRRAIIEAAERLFVERGYAGATMAAIAAEARVAPKSVYALAEKPKLLLLALDQAIAGDDEPVAVLDRPELQAVLDDPDPTEQVRAVAALGAAALLRFYRLYRAFEQAVAAEPDLLVPWRDYQRQRRSDVVRLVRAISARSPLRPGLTEERAVDTLWALLTWHPVSLLVDELAWTPEQLEAWLRDLMLTLLLPPAA